MPSADPHGTVHPEWEARQKAGSPRFKVYIYEHAENEEPGWKYKLFLYDHKYQDSDGYPIDAVAGGDSWAESFARAGDMIDQALKSNDCIF
jgi:hypothetical protein